MIDAALRLRACDLKLRHNIFNKISKRKRKEEKRMRNVQLRKRIEGQRKRAGWLKWKRQCKPNWANNYQQCNTKDKQRYNHTPIHNTHNIHNTQWVTTEPLQYSVQTDICSKWSMQWKQWDAEVLRLESRERIVSFSRLRGGRLPSEFVFVLLFVLLLVVMLVVLLYC